MTAIVIRFNHVEEFLDEVRRAPPTDGVVRITNRLTPTRISPTIRHLEVVATYVHDFRASTADPVQLRLVEFVKYVGDIWGMEAAGDEKVLAATDKLRGGLESEIAAAGLEIRAGICTIAGPSPVAPAREFSADLRLVRDAFQKLRQAIAAEATARSAPLPMPSGRTEQGVADAAEQLERAIAHLENAESCAPSTILGRIDGTLRRQARDLEIVDQVLHRIADHLVVLGAPLGQELLDAAKMAKDDWCAKGGCEAGPRCTACEIAAMLCRTANRINAGRPRATQASPPATPETARRPDETAVVVLPPGTFTISALGLEDLRRAAEIGGVEAAIQQITQGHFGPRSPLEIADQLRQYADYLADNRWKAGAERRAAALATGLRGACVQFGGDGGTYWHPPLDRIDADGTVHLLPYCDHCGHADAAHQETGCTIGGCECVAVPGAATAEEVTP